jgi:deoxyadenosine/deoxycytidine kinase
MVISFEGLPGAGKTTAAGLVGERLGAGVLKETTGDHPFLAQVYDDHRRDNLTVELAFLLVHANAYRLIDRRRPNICDYSPAKDLLFAEDMLRGKELKFFTETYDFVYDGHPLPDLVVYLRAAPELCLRRVRERMKLQPERAFEKGMTLDRLERMQDHYERGLGRLGDRQVIYEMHPDMDENETANEIVELLRSNSETLAIAV